MAKNAKNNKNKPKSKKPKVTKAKQVAPKRKGNGAMRVVRANMAKEGNYEGQLMRTLMLPADTPSRRWPTDPPQQTSVFKFEQIKSVWATATRSTGYLFFKDPVYPVWQYLGTGNAYTISKYRAVNLSESAVLQTMVFPVTLGESVSLNISPNLLGNTLGTGTFGSDYVTDLVVGSMSREQGVWWYVPSGAIPFANITAGAGDCAGGTWGFTLQFSRDGNFSDVEVIRLDGYRLTATTIECKGDVNNTPPGWYRLLEVFCTVSATTPTAQKVTYVSIGFLSAGSTNSSTLVASDFDGYYPLSSIGGAEISAAPSIYQACRLNAASVLFQNVTAVMNKEGAIRCGVLKVSGNRVFGNAINLEALLADSLPATRHTGRLENGLYTFFHPEMSGKELRDSLNVATINTPLFQLGALNYMYYVAMTPASQDQTLQLTYIAHLETQNDSMLFETGFCVTKIETCRQAELKVMSVKPFLDNPIHWGYLAAAAKQLAGAAWNKAKPRLNPWAHRAVDYLIPKYQNLTITGRPTNPYR